MIDRYTYGRDVVSPIIHAFWLVLFGHTSWITSSPPLYYSSSLEPVAVSHRNTLIYGDYSVYVTFPCNITSFLWCTILSIYRTYCPTRSESYSQGADAMIKLRLGLMKLLEKKLFNLPSEHVPAVIGEVLKAEYMLVWAYHDSDDVREFAIRVIVTSYTPLPFAEASFVLKQRQIRDWREWVTRSGLFSISVFLSISDFSSLFFFF